MLPDKERIASRISWEDAFIEEMSAGIDKISMFDRVDRCFDGRLSSTSEVTSHNVSLDATVHTTAVTSLID